MARTSRQAVDYARATTTNWHDRCLAFVSACYDISTAGIHDAADAWAQTKHRGVGPDVYGSLVWWTGGSQGYGHVALSIGGGWCWSSDFSKTGYVGDGRVRLIPVASISQHTPILRYRGWSRDLGGKVVVPVPNGVKTIHVYHGDAPKPSYRTDGGKNFSLACEQAGHDITEALKRGFETVSVKVVES